MYHGADLSEYDLVLSNSQGAVDELLAFGARRAEVLWWGADPASSGLAPRWRTLTCSSTAWGSSIVGSG